MKQVFLGSFVTFHLPNGFLVESSGEHNFNGSNFSDKMLLHFIDFHISKSVETQ